MGQVIVRKLDDVVIDSLKARAKRRGHSLEQELRNILSKSARLTKDERVALAERIRAMTPPGVAQTDSTQLIREDRDTR